MAFFKRNVGAKKRNVGRGAQRKSAPLPKRQRKADREDVEIPSSDDEELTSDDERPSSGDEEIFEDVEEKTAREAKRVLGQLKVAEKPPKSDDELTDEDLDAIAHRLQKDITEKIQKEHRRIADKVVVDDEPIAIYRPHRFSPVCVAISNDGRYVVSCSKDGSVVKYDIEEDKQMGKMTDKTKDFHKGQVKAVAISGDDKYLATGGDDKIVRIWNFADLSHVKNFFGHRGPITSLAFRLGSNDLYSSSTDRSIRSWNLGQMGFVEILYGHADPVNQIDILYKPRLLSAGTTARTVHLFKIEQSSQLVFNGLSDCTSIDTVSMINDDHYVSGQMDGSLYIWSVFKKKPVCIVKSAHGTCAENGQSRWIITVAALPFTDLVVSGSSDGKLKLWKISENYKSLTIIEEIELPGFINDIRFSADGKTLVCAVGQEHRSGRWWSCKEARNSIVVLSLEYDSDKSAEDQNAPLEDGDAGMNVPGNDE